MPAASGSMLSVIIATHESERSLLPTLAALVSATAAGLVREVIVTDAGSRDETTAVADVAGCNVIVAKGSAGTRQKLAAAQARAPWLLFLRPGSVPQDDWIAEVSAFVDKAAGQGAADRRAAVFRRAGEFGGERPAFAQGLALMVSALRRSAPPGEGLLIAKDLYDAVGGHDDTPDAEKDMLRRLGAHRIVLLRCGASPPRS